MRALTRLLLVFGVVLALPLIVLTQSQAARVHERAIVVDTHADTTQRLVFDPKFNLGERHSDGHIDIPRMKEGGLDALFFSIWVPSDVVGPPALERAYDQIDAVRETVRT